MRNSQNEITQQKIKEFSFGTLEYRENNIFKININEDTFVNDQHIEEFSNEIKNREQAMYGILLNVSNSYFCSEEIAVKFNNDEYLKAIAILVKQEDKLQRSKFMLELASLLPNPFQVPVKFFKKSDLAEEWLRKHLRKK